MSNDATIYEAVKCARHRIRPVFDGGDRYPDIEPGCICLFCDGIDNTAQSIPLCTLTGCRPPYEHMFIEYRSADSNLTPAEKLRIGVMLKSFPSGENTEILGYVFAKCTPQYHMIVGPLAQYKLTVDKDGKVIPDDPENPNNVLMYGCKDLPTIPAIVANVARDISYVFSLMNCKNVEIVDGGFTDDGLSPKQIRGGGRFHIAFKVLKVTVGKTRTYVLGKATSGESKNLPVHLVRGHFAEYTPERPMFGRNGSHGKFWIPAHARGKEENGVIIKDYELEKSE